MPRPMQVPRAGELLARMDDVVDLAVLLRRPGPHVGARVRVRVEAPDVALPQVEGRFAVDQPLRHRLADTAGVGDPDRLGRPEPPHLGRLAEDGEPVGGKGEQAVEPAGKSHPLEAGLAVQLQAGQVVGHAAPVIPAPTAAWAWLGG